MTTITTILVDKADLHRAEAVTTRAAVEDGQALFAVDSFALTANNITYAAHGEDMNYWGFYPAADGKGIVPVWGFATAMQSRVEGIAAGDRFYGYWPMASHAVLQPVKVSPRGFHDGAAHRQGLAAVYNSYLRADPAAMGDERLYALFRPLFITSFLIDDFLADRGGTASVILSSASSKTALGLAQLLTARGDVRVIGLTSPSNLSFVEATGYYDDVATYDAVPGGVGGAVYVDFAGDDGLRARVHVANADTLTASLVIGDTHWNSGRQRGNLPGPRPEFFFAPTQVAKRMQDWGPAGFDQRLTAAWTAFTGSTAGWLRIVEATGADAALARYGGFVAGKVDPAEGHILAIR
jgi:hypothetical protein